MFLTLLLSFTILISNSDRTDIAETTIDHQKQQLSIRINKNVAAKLSKNELRAVIAHEIGHIYFDEEKDCDRFAYNLGYGTELESFFIKLKKIYPKVGLDNRPKLIKNLNKKMPPLIFDENFYLAVKLYESNNNL